MAAWDHYDTAATPFPGSEVSIVTLERASTHPSAFTPELRFIGMECVKLTSQR
jgi:hypothetical protein